MTTIFNKRDSEWHMVLYIVANRIQSIKMNKACLHNFFELNTSCARLQNSIQLSRTILLLDDRTCTRRSEY